MKIYTYQQALKFLPFVVDPLLSKNATFMIQIMFNFTKLATVIQLRLLGWNLYNLHFCSTESFRPRMRSWDQIMYSSALSKRKILMMILKTSE